MWKSGRVSVYVFDLAVNSRGLGAIAWLRIRIVEERAVADHDGK